MIESIDDGNYFYMTKVSSSGTEEEEEVKSGAPKLTENDPH